MTVTQGLVQRETRFASKLPAEEILSKIEAAAKPLGFNAEKRNYKVFKTPVASDILHYELRYEVLMI